MLPCQVHIHPSSTLIHHLIKNLLSGVYPKHVCLCDFRVYGIRNSCQQTNTIHMTLISLSKIRSQHFHKKPFAKRLRVKLRGSILHPLNQLAICVRYVLVPYSSLCLSPRTPPFCPRRGESAILRFPVVILHRHCRTESVRIP